MEEKISYILILPYIYIYFFFTDSGLLELFMLFVE